MSGLSDGARQIVVGVDASLEGWGAILHQEDNNKDLHHCCYGGGHWNKAENGYDAGKPECHGADEGTEDVAQLRTWGQIHCGD